MMDPEKLLADASHVVLFAWVATYLGSSAAAKADPQTLSVRFSDQTLRLRESALQLQLALEKMRLANEKLAARMAEHKAFFAKYKTAE